MDVSASLTMAGVWALFNLLFWLAILRYVLTTLGHLLTTLGHLDAGLGVGPPQPALHARNLVVRVNHSSGPVLFSPKVTALFRYLARTKRLLGPEINTMDGTDTGDKRHRRGRRLNEVVPAQGVTVFEFF
eukprot:1637770-Pyramimonas_sp.AAC.1